MNGIRIANIFKKELCLCYNCSKKEKHKKDELREKIASYLNPIKNELPGLKISTLLLSESLAYLHEKLAYDFEAILLIADSKEFYKYAKSVSESSVPFLFVNGKNEFLSEFKKLILPMDLRK